MPLNKETKKYNILEKGMKFLISFYHKLWVKLLSFYRDGFGIEYSAVMQELWGMLSTPTLALFPGRLCIRWRGG